MAVKIGLMLKGAGALIDAGTGGLVDANIAIPVITVLFVVYGIAGGGLVYMILAAVVGWVLLRRS